MCDPRKKDGLEADVDVVVLPVSCGVGRSEQREIVGKGVKQV